MLRNLKNKTYRFLRYAQKYTGTDNIYLLHGGFWLTLGQVISSLSAFLLAIAFANFLPKEAYGTYRYLLSIAGIIAIVALPGMTQAVIRAVAQGNEGSFMEGFKSKLRWGLLAAPISIAFASYYFINQDNILGFSFLLAALFLPVMDAFGHYHSLLHGKKLFGESTKYFSLTQVIATAALAATVLLTDNIFVILLAYFLGSTIPRLIFFLITLKKFPATQQKDPQTVTFGKHLSLLNLFGIGAANIDKILIFHYLGAVEVAIYVFATAVPDQMRMLLKNLPKLALPKFSQRSAGEIKSTLFRKILLVTLIMVPVVALYFLVAPYIYKFIFPQYTESIAFSQAFALMLLLGGGGLPSAALKSQMAVKQSYILDIFSGISQTLLMFVFVTLGYGIWGVIAGRLLAKFLTFALSLVLVKKL
ncbi:MAG: oligosaccharide flippase family protein [Candidatus Spechtbacterales bacterium]